MCLVQSSAGSKGECAAVHVTAKYWIKSSVETAAAYWCTAAVLVVYWWCTGVMVVYYCCTAATAGVLV